VSRADAPTAAQGTTERGTSGHPRVGPRSSRLLALALAVTLARPACAADAPSPRYDTHYFFAATRALVADPMHDGWKALLAPATVGVDLASLPFAALLGLGGLRGGGPDPASDDPDAG